MLEQRKLNSPTPITNAYDTSKFHCGNLALNDYLQKYALQNHLNGSARTYVATMENNIIGYYSLAFGSVSHSEATKRIRQGLARHSIPIILLARLAVDATYQNKGLGKGLLKDALLRTIQAAEIGGLRAVVVHAKDQPAKNFYQKYGFEASPIDPLHLFLLMKDLRNSFRI